MVNIKIDVFGGNFIMEISYDQNKKGKSQVNGFDGIFSKEIWTSNHIQPTDKIYRVDGQMFICT